MLYYNKLNMTTPPVDTVITAGKFDGVHRGHQLLLSRIKEIAKQYGMQTCVFTFHTSPQARLSHRKTVSILDNRERMRLMEQFGMDILVECPFTEAIRNLSPEDFIRQILIERLGCRAIVVGTDFYFGRDRAGSPGYLLEEGPRLGLQVEVIDKLMDNDREISSTYVREELRKGNIPKVNELLGFPFFAEGTIVHGAHNGHRLGFPTVNILPDDHKLLPPCGVYATQIVIGGQRYKSITNIGYRPTFDGERISIETNIPGFTGDLYGEEAHVEFYEFTRPERRFSSVEELREQIRKDVLAQGFVV